MTHTDVDNTAAATMLVACTKFGKDITITRGRFGRMFEIAVVGGGSKPPTLEGMFTGYDQAFEAVQRYVGIEDLPGRAVAGKISTKLVKREKVRHNSTFLAESVGETVTEAATQE